MKRNFPIAIAVSAMVLAMASKATAQSELYPKHFDLEQVELLDGPMKTAMNLNIKMLLQYDTDRLLTPFVRQAGLASTTDSSSPYYQWLTKHPNFKNWGGDAGFDLSGHVGGHYLSALALAYAACHDENVRAQLKERMDYMLNVMKDCQDAYDQNTEGLYGNSIRATFLASRATGAGCPSMCSTRFWPVCAMPISMATATWPRSCSANWPTGA